MAYYCLAGILWVVDFSNNRYEFSISTRVCKAVFNGWLNTVYSVLDLYRDLTNGK